MDRKISKLTQHQEEELTAQEATTAQNLKEFATPEELLRMDAAQTPVPPHIRERLEHSLEREGKPRSGWRRGFGL